jgi:hypothetical protein
MKEVKRQQYSRLTAKSGTKIRTWNIVRKDRKNTFYQMPSFLINSEKVKGPGKLLMLSVVPF